MSCDGEGRTRCSYDGVALTGYCVSCGVYSDGGLLWKAVVSPLRHGDEQGIVNVVVIVVWCVLIPRELSRMMAGCWKRLYCSLL